MSDYNKGNDTPTLADTIEALINAKLVDLHTCLPAKVVTYNSAKQTADVLPSLMRKYEGADTAIPLPIIPDVPVVHPKTLLAHVHMPINPGDNVLLVFSERSLDEWKLSDGPIDPDDTRKFHLSDAFALVGGAALPGSFSVSNPQAVEIANGIGEMSLDPAGNIMLGKVTPFSVGLAEPILARITAIEAFLNAFVALYTSHVHNIILPVPATPTATPIPPGVPLVPVIVPLGSAQTKVQA